MQLLLDADAQLDALSAATDETIIHAAAAAGSVSVLEHLLQIGGIEALLCRNNRGETALHSACANTVVAQRILNGSMSCVVMDGAQSDETCVLMLLSHAHGAMRQLLMAVDRDGASSLHFAVRAARTKGVEQLLFHADVAGCLSELVNLTDFTGSTALLSCIRVGEGALCRLLLNAGADTECRDEAGNTALHCAVHANQIELLKLLLSKAADPSTVDGNGLAALHSAARHGATECVAALLDAACDADIKSANALTPLMQACSQGHQAAAQLLLNAKAMVNAADGNGWGCVHHAAFEGNSTNIHLLVSCGASVDGNGLALSRDSFHSVCPRPTALKLVAAAVAFHSIPQFSPIAVFSEIRKQAVALSHSTPLTIAVQRGNLRFADLILSQYGADICRADGLGNQPIHHATAAADEQMCGLLLSHNASIEAANLAGCPPLFAACSSGQPQFVAWLLHRLSPVCRHTTVKFRDQELTALSFVQQYGVRGLQRLWKGEELDDDCHINGDLDCLAILQPRLETVLKIGLSQ